MSASRVVVLRSTDETLPFTAPKPPKIVQPTRVLWGRHDPVLRSAWIEFVPEYFENVEAGIAEDAGHFVHYETPDAAAAEIDRGPYGNGLGGRLAELITDSGCSVATAVFWATDEKGAWVSYVAGTTIAAVNGAVGLDGIPTLPHGGGAEGERAGGLARDTSETQRLEVDRNDRAVERCGVDPRPASERRGVGLCEQCKRFLDGGRAVIADHLGHENLPG